MKDQDIKIKEYFSDNADVRRCPMNHFAEMVNHEGLYYHPEIRAYIVARNDDARQVLSDPLTFSSKLPFGIVAAEREREVVEELRARDPGMEELIKSLKPRRTPVLVNCDPPQHMRQRRLVNTAFAPARIAKLAPQIEMIVDELIGTFSGKPEVEIVSELCIPLPVRIMAERLGVDEEHKAKFKQWSDDFMSIAGSVDLSSHAVSKAMYGQSELYSYLQGQIEDRRANPGEDLISDIVHARQDGDEPLTVDEMLAMCGQFLVAGNETTTALLASAILILATRPELADSLREDKGKIPRFIEEVLVREGPVQGVYRQVVKDTTIGGFPVAAGEQVFVVHGAANRTAPEFSGEEIDLELPGRPNHISFGLGEHFCLGFGLARMEVKITLEAMLTSFSSIKLADGEEIEYSPTFMLRSLKSLRLNLIPS